jgi:hypothetical protein
MQELGLNTVTMFIPGRRLFNGLELDAELCDRVDEVLALVRAAGMKTMLFGPRGYRREDWCAAQGIAVPDGLWHPAVQPAAAAAYIAAQTAFRSRYADHDELIGYPTGVSRFFRHDFSVPPVRQAWAQWLRRRFDDDLDRARELLQCADDERAWEDIRTPCEMEPYFNEDNPRSCEFALMHQVLTSQARHRVYAALKPVTPRQLLFTVMEGCCFSTGHLNAYVPELFPGDAVFTECYHWEGVRSGHIQTEDQRRWMREPVADKPSSELINNEGYVHMLVRWMRGSGLPVVVCHGADIGEVRRGVRNEDDHATLVANFNAWAIAAGARGINYWCWTDDEQSKTFTRRLGVEYTIDTPAGQRPYQQSGETMGLMRLDGSVRPAGAAVRAAAHALRAAVPDALPRDTLVLFPHPVFQSLYRYRANLTGFGILTALARLGVNAECMLTSAGEQLVTRAQLAPYAHVIVGAQEYLQDHPSMPDVLAAYVRNGGTLLLPLGYADQLRDEYLQWRSIPALAELAGCDTVVGREERASLADITRVSGHCRRAWTLTTDTGACFTRVRLAPGSELLAAAGGEPLLYRHQLGAGRVYVFTWNFDVFMWQGSEMDYNGGDWDWLLETIRT